MKLKYYSDFESLMNDIKKVKKFKKISCSKEKREIYIDSEIIKFECKNFEFRSFSVPFLKNDNLMLEYSGNNDSLKVALDNICTAYTDNEINAILESMPVLMKYSKNKKNRLENVAIIWRDHFLEENVGLLSSFIRMGVNPHDILAFDKGDSTKHRIEITKTFNKMGINTDVLDNTKINDNELIKHGKEVVDNFILNRKDKKIVILDDGAIITKIIENGKYKNIVGFLELTVMGLKRIGTLEESQLSYPVLNLAKTELKRFITYREIANTIFLKIIELLGGQKLLGRNVFILGYGDLGENLARLFGNYGTKVYVIEPDILKCIKASEMGFKTYTNIDNAIKYKKPFLLIGASGFESITENTIKGLGNETFITSGATADLNIFKKYLGNKYEYKYIPKYGSQFIIDNKKITILGNGRSINLFDSEAIPNQSNDIFKASQLVVVDYLINNKLNLFYGINSTIVDEIINDSKILNDYYDLYFNEE